jgi:hypothetical protein
MLPVLPVPAEKGGCTRRKGWNAMKGIVFSICLNTGCAVLAPNGLWWQGQCVFGPCNEHRVRPPAIVRPPRVERRLPPRAHAEPPPPVAPPDAPPVAPPAAPPQRAPDDQLEGGPEVPLTPSVPSHPPRPYLQR